MDKQGSANKLSLSLLVLIVLLLTLSACTSGSADIVVAGDNLLARSDYNGALMAYGKALEADSTSALAHSRRCYVLSLLQDYDAALSACEQAIAIAPDDAEALATSALVYNAKGDTYTALDTARQALAADSDNALAHIALAQAHISRGTLDDALTIAQEAITLAPDDAHAYATLGSALQGMNRWEEAGEAFEKAIELEPDFALWQLRLASWHDAQGQWEEALALAEEAVTIAPQECRAVTHEVRYQYFSGTSLENEDKASEAYDGVLSALRINPLCQDAYSLLYSLQLNFELPEEFEALFEEASQEYPTSIPLHFAWAERYGLQRLTDQEEEIVQSLLERAPDSYDLHVAYAKYYLNVGFHGWRIRASTPLTLTVAIDRVEQALQLDPDRIDGQIYLAKLLNWADRSNEANEVLLDALDTDPDRVDTYVQFAELNRWANRELVVGHLESAVASAPWNVEVRRMLCEHYGEQGRLDEAIEQCEEVIALRPWDPEGYMSLAELYADRGYEDEVAAVLQRAEESCPQHLVYAAMGYFSLWIAEDLEEAESYYLQAIELDPDNAFLYANLGNAYKEQDEYDQAAAAFQRTLEAIPNEFSSLLGLTNVRAAQGRWNEAEQLCSAATTSKWLLGYWVHVNLAEAYEEQGQVERAIEHYLAADDPVFYAFDYHSKRLLDLLVEQGREDEAIARWQDKIRRFPRRIGAYVELGNLYRDLGEDELAQEQYQAAIEADPKAEEPYLRLADLLIDSREDDRGREVIEAMVAAKPSDPERYIWAATFYADHQMYNEAIAATEQAIAEESYARYWAVLGDVYREAERHAEAVDAYRNALDLIPQNSDYHLGLARCLRESENEEDVEAEYLRAFELDRSDVTPLSELARWHAERGSLEQALAVFDLYPNRSELRFELGVFYREQGMYEESVDAFQQATNLDPEIAYYYGWLGVAYCDNGQYEISIPSFQKAIDLDPQTGWYHGRLAQAYYELGSHEEALAELQQAVELDPNDSDAWAWLGSLFYESNRLSDATDALEEAVALDNDIGWYHRRLGDCYRELGDYELARTEYERALELNPDDDYAREALLELP